jgi:hypothetical protein
MSGAATQHMPRDPPDLVLDIRRFGDWRLIAASYRGISHIRENTPRQDAYTLQVNSFSDSDFCLSVADGLGSGDFSHLGAQFCCQCVSEIFSQHSGRIHNEDDLRKIFKTVSDGFLEFSRQNNLQVKQIATTLQCLAVVGDKGYYFGLGDGGCVVLQHGEGRWLGGKDKSKLGVSNISDPNALEAITTDVVDAYETDAIFMFSDGVQEFFIEEMGEDFVRPHQKNVNGFHQLSQDHQLEKVVAAINKIMGSDQGRDMADDKTLLIAVRERRREPRVEEPPPLPMNEPEPAAAADARDMQPPAGPPDGVKRRSRLVDVLRKIPERRDDIALVAALLLLLIVAVLATVYIYFAAPAQHGVSSQPKPGPAVSAPVTQGTGAPPAATDAQPPPGHTDSAAAAQPAAKDKATRDAAPQDTAPKDVSPKDAAPQSPDAKPDGPQAPKTRN